MPALPTAPTTSPLPRQEPHHSGTPDIITPVNPTHSELPAPMEDTIELPMPIAPAAPAPPAAALYLSAHTTPPALVAFREGALTVPIHAGQSVRVWRHRQVETSLHNYVLGCAPEPPAPYPLPPSSPGHLDPLAAHPAPPLGPPERLTSGRIGSHGSFDSV